MVEVQNFIPISPPCYSRAPQMTENSPSDIATGAAGVAELSTLACIGCFAVECVYTASISKHLTDVSALEWARSERSGDCKKRTTRTASIRSFRTEHTLREQRQRPA